MKIHFCIPVIILLFQGSCFQGATEKKPEKGKSLFIQPFKNMPEEDVSYVMTEIKRKLPNLILKKEINYPAAAFNKERNRYRADSLIKFLAQQTPDGHVTIGLTNLDISTTKDGVKDWGVMGLGYQPGKACVASTFRLSKENRKIQLYKVAIHELGHTYGLPHCPVKTCFMRDAEGKNPTNEEIEFCPDCKSTLLNEGWKF